MKRITSKSPVAKSSTSALETLDEAQLGAVSGGCGDCDYDDYYYDECHRRRRRHHHHHHCHDGDDYPRY